MDKKELFNLWAPQEGHVWTRFAKPALFVHTSAADAVRVSASSAPIYLRQFNMGDTAVIIDLPSDMGIREGLGLANAGFRPITLYNGIHEPKNGGLSHVVDNTAIISALAGGADTLRYAHVRANAAPVFLLDANRDNYPAEGMYDNRWAVDTDDMPDAAYMKAHGINRVILWSEGAVKNDINEILNEYHMADISVMIYADGQAAAYIARPKQDSFEPVSAVHQSPLEAQINPDTKEAIRKFENARFALLVAIGLAGFNLIGMFFINEEPLLWTVPCIMWLTYLWVSEPVGDAIAIIMTLSYFTLYWFSQQKRILLPIAAALFGFDVLVYFIYVISYGVMAFTGYSFEYGLIVWIPPIIILVFLVKGAIMYKQTDDISDDDYCVYLDHIDGETSSRLGTRQFRPRRRLRFYRGARYRGGFRGYGGGYRGYGGTGRGGYGGGFGGYGGFGG